LQCLGGLMQRADRFCQVGSKSMSNILKLSNKNEKLLTVLMLVEPSSELSLFGRGLFGMSVSDKRSRRPYMSSRKLSLPAMCRYLGPNRSTKLSCRMTRSFTDVVKHCFKFLASHEYT
jgi:hypothetical protein